MKFEKEIVQSTKGLQSSKWDVLEPEFDVPGRTLFFDESEVTRQQAAQGATRLRLLTGKAFHSGYNPIKKKSYIRLRLDGEVPDKEDKEGEPEKPSILGESDEPEEYSRLGEDEIP